MRERAKFLAPMFTAPLADGHRHKRWDSEGSPARAGQVLWMLVHHWRAGRWVGVSPEAWTQHLASLDATAKAEPCEDITPMDRDVARGRLWHIRDVSSALLSDARQASFMSPWRHRSRTLWKLAKHTGGYQHSAAAATEDKDADVQKEINDLHHSAETRLDNPKSRCC